MMKNYLLYVLLLCTLPLCAGQKKEKLLLSGSGWNKIVIVDKESKTIEWEHPLSMHWECNSVSFTPDGNILFSYRRGAKVVGLNHEEVWRINAPAGCEMQTARVLPDGNYLLAWTGHPAVMLEVDRTGEILSKTEYETGIENTHSQFRQVNKNKRGNYLLPLMGTGEIREVSPKGELLRTVRVEGKPFTIMNGKGDCCWVACGDRHRLLKIDWRSGEVLAQFGENDIDNVRLFFVAGLCPVSGDGLYVCNWQGHSPDAAKSNMPQLFQLDAQGRCVWSLNDNRIFGMISAVDSSFR